MHAWPLYSPGTLSSKEILKNTDFPQGRSQCPSQIGGLPGGAKDHPTCLWGETGKAGPGLSSSALTALHSLVLSAPSLWLNSAISWVFYSVPGAQLPLPNSYWSFRPLPHPQNASGTPPWCSYRHCPTRATTSPCRAGLLTCPFSTPSCHCALLTPSS